MLSRHLTEYNTLRDIVLHKHTQTDQYAETVVRRRALSVMFNISHARVWRNNRPYD